ncbi:hypothetical protein ACIA8I_37805 [Streptomyces rishiriensis]|uniref:hypothetical protein n=1 Tax=Streptomyces rishiriensis TaxID=68264 RepID=UPI0037977378
MLAQDSWLRTPSFTASAPVAAVEYPAADALMNRLPVRQLWARPPIERVWVWR